MKYIKTFIKILKQNKTNLLFLFFIVIFIFANHYYSDGRDPNFPKNSSYNDDFISSSTEKYTLSEAKVKIDSVKSLMERSEKFNNSQIFTGITQDGFSLRDIENNFNFRGVNKPAFTTYFGIQGFTIKPNRKFIANGDSNIIKLILKDTTITSYTKYRYNYESKILLMPIKEKYYSLIQFLFTIITFISFIIGIATLYYTVKVLAKIASGKAFIIENYVYLIRVSKLLVIFSLGTYSIKVIFYLFLYNQIKNDFYFKFLENLSNYNYPFVAALVFYIIAQAFKRGIEMQEEQEFTV